jgi:DNA-directed RNA polymerase sigma subunit (sigma70/sigma32)
MSRWSTSASARIRVNGVFSSWEASAMNARCLSPTEEEIAKRLGCSVEEVRGATSAAADAISLDKPLGAEEGSAEIGDFVRDEHAQDMPDAMVGASETADLWALVERLPERSRYVLSRRYGLDGHEKTTLNGLARELGISLDRVRQIQQRGRVLSQDPLEDRRAWLPPPRGRSLEPFTLPP